MTSLSNLTLILLLLLNLPALAQSAPSAQPATPGAPYTLRLHQDLVQIPVLVLDKDHKPRPSLNAQDFSIRLDSGQPFHPRNTHLEADDPLSIVFLLDAGTISQQDFLRLVQKHFADLPPTLFRPQDRLSVFAFDCNFIATAQDQPASNALLQHAVADAISSPNLHAPPHQRCAKSLFLWDAVNGAASLSDSLPGRRVMFVLSPGQDKFSVHTWQVARRYTAGLGFTLFGLRDVDGVIGTPEDSFALLCGGTGGIDVYITPHTINLSLPSLFDIIRHRYIVEFPLPANGSIGLHHLDVTLADRDLIVRSGGDSTPLLDPSNLPDPTLTPDAAARPTFGTRKPMDPK